MAESSANDLFVGAFGKLYYDSEQQKWLSTRRITANGDGLHTLGLAREYIGSEELPGNHRVIRAHEARLAIQNLQRAIPAFGLVSHPDLEEDYAPEFRKKLESLMDGWKVGDLISQTRLHPLNDRKRSSRIVALPAGDSGNFLKVFELRDARQGWGLSKTDVWLKTYELHDVDSVTLKADGRIRQICFAKNQADGSHPLLAIRTAKTIAVLFPQLLPPETVQQSGGAAGGRIQIEEVHTFGIEALDGAEFVDLDFCPWFPSSFAAIAESGKWLLATLVPGQNRVEESDTVQGEVDPPDDEPNDNWHAILWTSINSFVVCNRSHLKAFRRQGNDVTTVNEDVIASQTKLTILDMRRSPVDDTAIFITTTTHIMYLRGHRDVDDVHADMTYSISLSWRHNRDLDDHTLKLILVEETAGLKIMLFSRATSLTTVYDLAMTEHEHPLPLTSAYSHTSNLIPAGSNGSTKSMCSDIVVLQTELRGRLTEEDANLDEGSWLKRCLTNGYGFYQSFILSDDMSIKGQIAYARLTDINQEQTSSESLFVPAPIWSVCRSRPVKSSRSTIEENFIDDDAVATSKTGNVTSSLRRLRQDSALHNLSSRTDEDAEWTIPFNLAYNAMTSKFSTTATTAEMAIEGIAARFDGQSLDSSFCSIALLLPQTQHPQDFDAGLHIVSMLQSAFAANNSNFDEEYTIEVLGSSSTLGLASTSDTTSLAEVRDYFAERYSTPLAKRFSAEVHEHQDQLVDRLAWQITLASLCIRATPKEEPELELQAPMSSQMFPFESSQATALGISQLDSQMADAQAGEMDNVPAEDHNPDLINAAAQQAESIASVVSRLQRLTTMINPPTSQSNTIALTLNHWQVSSDPAVYSYEDKIASQTGTINLEGSAMSAEVVQEMKKLKEKQARKKRKTAEAANQAGQRSQMLTQDTQDSGQFASSQMGPSSSQFMSQGFGASSQAVASQMTAASQAVPGRATGRPATGRKPGRGKARRAGF